MWQEVNTTEDGHDYPIFKVMLQRVDPKEKSAYWKGAGLAPRIDDKQESCPQCSCDKCGENSPVAFRDQPSICLNKKCTEFFAVNGAQLQRHTLEYSEIFLNWIKPFSGDRSQIPDTVPPPPGKDTEGYGTELRCRTGMVCPKCHHCDSRVFFSYWKCSSCGFVHMAEPDPYPMAGVEGETQEHTKRLSNSKQSGLFREDGTTVFMAAPEGMEYLPKSTSKKSTSQKSMSEKESAPNKPAKDKESGTKGFVTKFSTKDARSTRTIYMIFDPEHNFIGSLVHERPSSALKNSQCGANELWNEIQEPGVTKDFKRNAARCSGSKNFQY